LLGSGLLVTHTENCSPCFSIDLEEGERQVQRAWEKCNSLSCLQSN
jgi:hypothetical protein